MSDAGGAADQRQRLNESRRRDLRVLRLGLRLRFLREDRGGAFARGHRERAARAGAATRARPAREAPARLCDRVEDDGLIRRDRHRAALLAERVRRRREDVPVPGDADTQQVVQRCEERAHRRRAGERDRAIRDLAAAGAAPVDEPEPGNAAWPRASRSGRRPSPTCTTPCSRHPGRRSRPSGSRERQRQMSGRLVEMT